MGFAPPADAPPPDVQDAASAAASLPAAPVGALLCGFPLPAIPQFPGFVLPPFPPKFDFPPTFPFPIPPLCDLAKAISDSVGYGGGRVGRDDLEKDPEG